MEFAQIVHGEELKREKRVTTISELLSQVKATIFDKYVGRELNRLEKNENRRVELSYDRKNLILHLDAEEQIDIHQKTIK